jgi:malate dehydrogenase
MAYAGYRFVERLIEAKWGGKSGIVEYTCACELPAALRARQLESTDVLLSSDKEGSKEAVAALGDGVEYFSVPVELGVRSPSESCTVFADLVTQPDGVKKIHPLPKLNDFEKKLLQAAIPELKGNISKVCRGAP